MYKWLILALGVTCNSIPAQSIALAQDNAVKLEAKAPLEKMKWETLREQLRSTRNFRLGAPFNFKILNDGKRFYYLKTTPPSTAAALYEFQVETGIETKILEAENLKAQGEVSQEEKALRERLRLMTSGISFYATDAEGRYLLVPLSGKLFVYDTQTKKASELAEGKGSIFSPKLSPDAKSVAFVRDSNLYVTSLNGGKVHALTSGGTEEKSFGVAEFIAQEELDRTDGYWWSPDSKTILYQAVDQSGVERLSIADPFKPDSDPQRPYYPRPGKANAKHRFGFIPVSGGSTVWVDFSAFPHEYVATVKWSANGEPSFLLLDRLQKHARLVSADPKTGKTKLLVEEKDKAWVEVQASSPYWLPDRRGFLWLTDSKGIRSLEYRDYNGEKLKDITLKDMPVRSIQGVSEDGNKVYLEIAKDSAHTEVHVVDLISGQNQVLAQLNGGTVSLSAEVKKGLFITREQNLEGSDKFYVRTINKKIERQIPSAAVVPVLNANVKLEKISADAVYVAIVRPSNFVAGKKYPVLERAYGGPSSIMVRANGRGYLEDQVMADAMQAIVVRMDTRGTPDRNHDWEKAISKKFGSLPVNEHAEVLKQLIAKFPEMDSKRIGVFGWSYGGYFAAYAALARPDVYKAAVAGAPPVDWLDYDTAYTERYLGLPKEDSKAYESASLLPLVKPASLKDQKTPILLIHGTADDNVFFLNSLKLVDALERAALPYEFLPLMGATHMIADEALDYRRFERTLQFFKKHLSPSSAKAGS